jgi:hypothetical protein
MIVLGQVIGRLTVIELTPKRRSHSKVWLCLCSCGTMVEVSGTNLSMGYTRSCGCLHKERLVSRSIAAAKHGHLRGGKESPTYKVWKGAIARCEDPKHVSYRKYGALGITMDPKWRNSFEEFLKDMGERPPGYSLDRARSFEGYKPGNCRWVTSLEQARNRGSNKLITYMGETLILAEWARRLGKPRTALGKRLNKGWSVERAFTTPMGKRTSKPREGVFVPGNLTRSTFNMYYKHLLRGPGDDLTFEQWQEILEKYDHQCAYCGVPDAKTMDHVVSLKNGGLHTASNVKPACRSCNSKKGSKVVVPQQNRI